MENALPLRESDRGWTPSGRVDNAWLIRQAQMGNAGAFEELVRQYDRAVLRLAIHLTGSKEDGQDVFQEAFLRAYVNLASFRFECSFYTWIYRIVTNLCLASKPGSCASSLPPRQTHTSPPLAE